MAEINAFVGHSFTEDDEQVVRIFQDFLTTLQNGIMSFSWDHARAAEPQELASKVLQKIEGKNVFIGICTRKDRIASKKETKYFGIPFSTTQYEWKTSDWIIQEIGLAIGKGLKLVLLVEEGVRSPGGLQGNIEYIPFNRANPQESFVKLLEMLRSISPRPATTMLISSESASERLPPESPNDESPSWLEPQPTWNRQNYQHGLYFAQLTDNTEAEQKIRAHFNSSTIALDNQELVSWRAFAFWLEIDTDKNGNIENLKKLTKDHPDSADAFFRLGLAHGKYENYIEAARAYEKAASLSTEYSSKIRYLKETAASYYKAGDSLNTQRMLAVISREGAKTDAEILVLRALKEMFDLMQNFRLSISVMERILEIEPTANDDRFSLAYEHSRHGSEDLSMYHYLKIPDESRTASGHNNLGVAYAEFKIPTLAVKSFKRAKALKETLAMSNLAYRLIDAGFLEEAELECKAAAEFPDYNNNINIALAKIRDLPETEQKAEEEVLGRARIKKAFFQKFGAAVADISDDDITGAWLHPRWGRLMVDIRNRELRAEATFKTTGETTANALASFSAFPPTEKTVKVSIIGNLYGRAMEGTIEKDDGSTKGISLLLMSENIQTLFFYVTGDGTELKCAENPFGKEPKFYSLRRPN